MAPERRRLLLILLVLVVLGVAAYRLWPAPAAAPAASNRRAPAGAPAARAKQPAAEAPSVNLPALSAERPKPTGVERNLFRFKPKPAPAPPPLAVRTDQPVAPVPNGPPPPPPVPAITLKFIGFADPGGQKGKIAALTDSAGHVFYGREGDIIEGRYRILKIGVESLDIAYLDGTGKRTVRLSGG